MTTRSLRRLRMPVLTSAVLAGAILVSGVSAETATTAGHRAGQTATVQLDQGKAQLAANNVPTLMFTDHRDDLRWHYWGFINQIRRLTNTYNNHVPGSSNTVDHTDSDDHRFFFVHLGANGHTVTLQLRRDNLYLVGWFTGHDVYNYIGDSNHAGIPASHAGRSQNWQAVRGADYRSLEHAAGTNRYQLRYSPEAFRSAVMALWRADRRDTQAAAALWMTQFISEAVRARGISDQIGWDALNPENHDGIHLDHRLIDQQTNWGQESQRFNNVLAGNGRDNNPMTGYYRLASGVIAGILMIHPADFARVWNMVLGHPKRH
ncbi:ribosome-inactivating family protein [Streptomyces sp. NPDC006385]|uniref:ribosome-inactivating family protein n=1 Tax=Streptomyces sp. NPDC006385 TaxID=3156761 RepID=UPI0033B4AB10